MLCRQTLCSEIALAHTPTLIWSDHGTNFVGVNNHLKKSAQFLNDQMVQKHISEFCTAQHIEWIFILERDPHFGGLRESSV